MTETAAAERPGDAPLDGRFVRLRAVSATADAEDLYEAAHRPETSAALWAYMHSGPFATQEDLRQWLDGRTGLDDLFLTVEQVASGRAIGVVAYMRIKPAMRVLELGSIWYLPEAQRTEANTEAVYLLLRQAFDGLGYRRVEWKCDALNARSRRAAVRLGFHFEGVFRQHMIIKGRNRDTAWYAMLDREWPRVKANMERWLYGGEQPRPSLSDLNR